jgi:hypothetical protein
MSRCLLPRGHPTGIPETADWSKGHSGCQSSGITSAINWYSPLFVMGVNTFWYEITPLSIA